MGCLVMGCLVMGRLVMGRFVCESLRPHCGEAPGRDPNPGRAVS